MWRMVRKKERKAEGNGKVNGENGKGRRAESGRKWGGERDNGKGRRAGSGRKWEVARGEW
jgi:hypothetical protein